MKKRETILALLNVNKKAKGPIFFGNLTGKEVENVKKEMIFEMSGLVKDGTSIEEIEFWGHDAGEFVVQEQKQAVETSGKDEQENP